MIDWDATKIKFNISSIEGTQKRPKVVCLCDNCHKQRIITIRVKSKVINNQLTWYCPSCVCTRRSKNISDAMKIIWQNNNYRDNQITQKTTERYKESQSKNAILRWENAEYRSKLEVGIRAEEYIATCKEKYKNQFEYDINSFTDWKNKILITCTLCKTQFYRKPLQHLYSGYCHVCNISSGQREISEFINDLGVNTELNNRTILNGRELDIIAQNKLAIEYNGSYWHSYSRLESNDERHRHQYKSLDCIKQGIRLIQIFDFQWDIQKDLIKSMISNALGLSTRYNARDLTITEITNNDAIDFFSNNHLQGYRPAKTTIALKDNNDIIIAASFSKHKEGFEIIRMATKTNMQVIGGASRIIRNFMKCRSSPLYSYADLMHSNGNVYKTIGFKEVDITKPGYFYIDKKYRIYSRQQCQKHKLHNMLGDLFNEELSEPQNMFNAGFRRMWTAGNILFKLTY